MGGKRIVGGGRSREGVLGTEVLVLPPPYAEDVDIDSHIAGLGLRVIGTVLIIELDSIPTLLGFLFGLLDFGFAKVHVRPLKERVRARLELVAEPPYDRQQLLYRCLADGIDDDLAGLRSSEGTKRGYGEHH